MKTIPRTALWLVTLLALLPSLVSAQTVPEDFAPMLSAAHRSPGNVARDSHRHPAQTLAFFGVRPDSTVVEILPGSGGYYMEILAPWLQQKGQYIAANRDESLPQYLPDHQKFLQRLKTEPALYGTVVVTQFRADRHPIAPPGSADFVISFRNLHNWMDRGRTDQTQAEQMANGYVREDLAIQLIEQAGFRLDGRSEVNANPLDTKDHPEGVWTLPPTYRLKDKDREKYRAIGESDRFTLRFVKP